MRFRDLPINLVLVKKESNLANHIRWLKYIAGPEFIKKWKEFSESGNNFKAMIRAAQNVVEEDIYAYNTTSGSGRIKASIDAQGSQTVHPGFILFSDPRVAPSKGPFSDGNPSDFSYAAFFEDPKFNTFIPPEDDPFDSRRYRPFFKHMTATQRTQSLAAGFRGLIRAIRYRMPRV